MLKREIRLKKNSMSENKLINKEKNIDYISVNGETFGEEKIIMIAGPCAVENKGQIFNAAIGVKQAGATFLRGGAFKPRTSPYSFQGMGIEGLKLLKSAADYANLKVISEILSISQLEEAIPYCDMVQVGSRNMQNFELLKAIGKSKVPVLLKRGFSATFDEWLYAAEYIMSEGNCKIILCERGIRSFDPTTRNVLDLSAIPIIKEKSKLPIIIDPSHATGNKNYVEALSLAAVAAGADGLMIEVHPNPETALSDKDQQLTVEEYKNLVTKAKKVALAVGRTI